MTSDGLSRLEDRLGHRFRNPALLHHALTHASTATDRLQSNERLEFLGDRVLGLIVANMLFEAFPDEPEGDFGPQKSSRHDSLNMGTLSFLIKQNYKE